VNELRTLFGDASKSKPPRLKGTSMWYLAGTAPVIDMNLGF